MSKYWLLVGSFNPLISTLQFTVSPPSLSLVSQFQSGTSPTWLAYSPKFSTTIYATDETDTGSINSLAFDVNTGGLTSLANLSTQGGAPTHLGFINNGTALAAANFVNGSAFIANLDATHTGQFSPTNNALVPFQGFGPLPNQLTPHAHQVGIVLQSNSLHTELTDRTFFFFSSRLCHSAMRCSSRTSVRTRFGALCSRAANGQSMAPLTKHPARVPGISS